MKLKQKLVNRFIFKNFLQEAGGARAGAPAPRSLVDLRPADMLVNWNDNSKLELL